MSTLQNRTALVTGANRGIGNTIVREFLRQGVKKVYAAARNVDSLEPLLAMAPGRVVAIQIDLTQPETISRAAGVADDVDLVVNNAGVLQTNDLLNPSSLDALQSEIDVNVYGLIRMAQAFAPVLKVNGGGTLVQLNSVASIKNFSALATYSASKAAAYSITQALRELLAEQGTQVISVHPGPIQTDMSRGAGMEDIAEPAERVSDAIISALETRQFHSFPDTMAKQFEQAYQGYAAGVIEANPESSTTQH